MRHLIIFIIAMASVLFACRTPKHVISIENRQTEAESLDSVEYVLEVFDVKFETWYALHNSPSQYRSKSYYEGWNRRYVSAWNYNASHTRNNWFFEPVIGYDPTTDYGFELNHKLFYYFMYVENVLKIEIMSGGPQSFHFNRHL